MPPSLSAVHSSHDSSVGSSVTLCAPCSCEYLRLHYKELRYLFLATCSKTARCLRSAVYCHFQAHRRPPTQLRICRQRPTQDWPVVYRNLTNSGQGRYLQHGSELSMALSLPAYINTGFGSRIRVLVPDVNHHIPRNIA